MKTKTKVISVMLISVLLLTVVGVAVTAANNSVLSFSSNGSGVEVFSCDVNAEGEVVIPETYNGKTVTGIAPSAFLNCEKIEKVIIPDTVTYIGDSAFERCLALKEIAVPYGVTKINDHVFTDCISLQKVTLPDSIKSIGYESFYNAGDSLEIKIPDSVTELSERCFFCSGVSSVTLSPNIKVIPKEAFNGSGLLESFVIPEGVVEIGELAFGGGAYFSTLNIPASVTKIAPRAFSEIPNLESFTVDAKNPSYTCMDGVLFNKNKTVVVSYPSRRENVSYTLPETVVEILDFTFAGNDFIEKLTLPDGLKTIGFGAFTNCRWLSEINLPDSLTTLEQGVFTRCYALEKIVIPESITVIPENCFYCCESLGNVKLPSKLTAIESQAFVGTKYEEDKSYWQNGFLYIDNYLIRVDRDLQGHADIKKGTKLIADYAFSLCSEVTSVNVPDGIKKIPYAMFLFCSSLENVSLPSSIEHIDAYAFSRTGSDWFTITFRGTPAQWANVKTDEAEVEFLANTAVSCSEFSAPLVEVENTSKGVLVSWSHHTGIDGFVVYRSEKVNGKWSNWKNLGFKTADTIGYYDNSVKSGTVYRYTVRLKKGNTLSEYKPSDSITYLVQPTVKIANASKGIKVSWTKSNGASQYIVYRSEIVNGEWSKWKQITKVASTSTSWGDASVKNGQKYKYTVRAVSGSCRSSYVKSNELVAVTQPTVSFSNVSTGIKVSWSKVASVDGYRVYRSTYTNGNWSKWKNMGTAASTKTSWVDGSVKSGQKYKYTVRAVNGSYLSSYVNPSGLLYLAEPLVGTKNGSGNIAVSWTKSEGAKGYRIYRSEYTNGKWSSWKNLGTLKSNKTSWVDKSIKSGVSYKYTVRAVNEKTLSSYTKTYNYYSLAQPKAKAANALKGVNVSWSTVSGARSYNIYRSEYKNGKWSSWSKISNVNAAKTSWVDSKATSGKTYKYTVRAVNEKVMSSYKATGALMNLGVPAFTCSGDGKKGITLSWQSVAGATEYYIYRKVDNAAKWTKIASVSGTNYVDKAVNDDGKCTYTIRAKNGSYMSSYKSAGTTISLNVLKDVFRLVNIERQKAGLHELEYCDELQSVVDLRAQELKKTYSHIRPDGTAFYTAIDEAGIEYYGASENIADGTHNPDLIMSLWMDSPSHKPNILDPYVTHMAVGFYNGAWVQIFVDLDGTLIFE